MNALVAELEDGRLMLNMRNYDRSQRTRRISFSSDGGANWSDFQPDPVLVEPICQASMLMFKEGDRSRGSPFHESGKQ